MITDDSSTLTLPPPGELTGPVVGLALVPALTIVWHPDLERVGDVAPLMELLENDVAPLTRRQPIFQPPGSGDGQPIGHKGMNRESAVEVWAARGGFELRRGKANAAVEVDGLPFDGTRRLSADDLRRGLRVACVPRRPWGLAANDNARGRMERRTRLGGLLNYYYRRAA